MVLRALALFAPLWSCSLFIGRRPLRRAAAAAVSVVVLSFGVSAAWGIPLPPFGPGWDGPGLGPADLTYHFGTPTADLTIEAQHQALAAALRVWSSASVVLVSFRETPFANQVRSIDINFQHFGTPSSTLAFAFPPPPWNSETHAGDIVFNDDFLWEVGNGLGFAAFDLTYVGVHESGHSLGLNHSNDPNSVEFPLVGSGQVFTGLSQEDIETIQSLYATPEPSTLLLFGTTAAGIGGLVRWRQRRRRQQP
jgi:Matrixin/PEP-CTERM motif